MTAEKVGLTDVLETLKRLNHQDLDWELRKLQGIREWALRQIGVDYTVGDRVQIAEPICCGGGWASYAECLSVGATGIVTGIDFALHAGRWYADFIPDREWQVSSHPFNGKDKRYWNGRASETPEGYEPPSKYNQEHYPEGRRHTFMFNVDWLTRATDGGASDA